MNKSANCANVLINEANISKLIDSYHSVLFTRENLIAGKDFCTPWMSYRCLKHGWISMTSCFFELNFFYLQASSYSILDARSFNLHILIFCNRGSTIRRTFVQTPWAESLIKSVVRSRKDQVGLKKLTFGHNVTQTLIRENWQ
jgi:hypothetical protein